MIIDCVVPAHNEEATIGDIVRVLLESKVFRRIIVADDGSTDQTAKEALKARNLDGSPAAVVRNLFPNRGKAEAMLAGVASSDLLSIPGPPADAYAFFDADLIGLTPEHVRLLAEHFAQGFDMVCGLQDSSQGSLVGLRYPNFIQAIAMPLLTGQRFLKRWVLEALPKTCWRGYAIEVAMNDVVDRNNGSTCLVLMKGVQGKPKQDKIGFLDGWRSQWKMAKQIRETKQALKSTGGLACKLPSK